MMVPGNAVTDDFYFSTFNGSWTARMMIQNSTGNVGVGTTNPGAKLVVTKDSTPANQSTLGSTAIYSSDNPGTLAMAAFVGADNTIGGPVFNGYKARNTAASPQSAIAGDALFGVSGYGWDTTAASDWKFGAAVDFRRDSGTGSQYRIPGYITFRTSQASDDTIYERMRITSSGNVGVGTTAPGDRLHVSSVAQGDTAIRVSGSSLDNNWGGGIRLTSDNGTTTNSKIIVSTNGLDLNNLLAAPVRLFTSNTERVRIDSAGNVGIGTTSPAAKLDVRGADAQVANDGAAGLTLKSAGGASTGNPYVSFVSHRGTLLAPTYPQDGDFLGGLTFSNQTGNSGATIESKAVGVHGALPNRSGGKLDFSTSPSGTNNLAVRMTIGDSGNVGIGITLPALGLQH